MSKNVMISFLGENKPNLISDVTNYLTEQGGEFLELLLQLLEEFVS